MKGRKRIREGKGEDDVFTWEHQRRTKRKGKERKGKEREREEKERELERTISR